MKVKQKKYFSKYYFDQVKDFIEELSSDDLESIIQKMIISVDYTLSPESKTYIELLNDQYEKLTGKRIDFSKISK